MRPLQLQATDFASYPKIDLLLTDLSLVAIVGDNGAGKSSLLHAIRIALFGSAVAPLDGFVRQGQTGFQVALTFQAGGQVYRVTREHGRKGQKAALSRHEGESWVPACESKVRDVDQAIEEIIGADHVTFVLAHHLPQGGLTHFATLDPAGRKTWLASKLPLEEYTRLEAQAKDLAKTLDDDLRDSLAKVSVWQEQVEKLPEIRERYGLADMDVAACQQTVERAEKQVAVLKERMRAAEELVVELDEKQMDAERASSRFRNCSEQEKRLAAEVERLEARANNTVTDPIADPDATGHRIAELETQVQVKRHVDKVLIPKRDALLERIKEVERKRDRAVEDHEDCPLCGATAEHQKQGQMVAVYTRQVLDMSAEHDEIKDEITAALTSIPEDPMTILVNLKDKYARHLSARETNAAAAEARRMLVEKQAEHVRLLADCRSAEEESSVANAALIESEERYEPYKQTARELEKALESVSEYHQELADFKARKQTLHEAVKNLEDVHDRLDEYDRGLYGLRNRKANLELLAKAYGRSGIQARLLEDAVAAIEASANAFLARFTDGMTVALETQRENKSGGVRETLDILVTDGAGTRPLERFSGGETTRVCFALAAGIAAFVQGASDVAAESFAVDEPEYLDPAGVSELVSCLHVMSADVPLVMLISHIDGVADNLPQKIVVRKTAEGSTAKVVTA